MHTISKFKLARRVGIASVVAVLFALPLQAQVKFHVQPTAVNFGSHAVGTASNLLSISVVNDGTTNVQIQSFSVTGSQFQITDGVAPKSVHSDKPHYDYTMKFVPDSAGAFSGTFTVTVQGFAPVTVPLTGTGFITNAKSSVSTTSIDFGNQAQGTTSGPKTVTIKNIGTDPLGVTSVTSSSQFYTLSKFTPTTLQPGQSLNGTVTFSPMNTQTYKGLVQIAYDVLPPQDFALTGVGVAPNSITITNLAALPAATQSAAYEAVLRYAGGSATGSKVFLLQGGSSLPLGLTLGSNGVISGTLDPSVAVGNYSFSIGLRDNGNHTITTKKFTIAVGAPTGAACNNIIWNVPGTSTPAVALTDLGAAGGTYLGFEAGLYPGGSNVRPPDHDAAGVNIAQNEIMPLDKFGNPDPVNGKIGLLMLGESAAQQPLQKFVPFANADPEKNPFVTVILGAMAGEDANDLAVSTNAYYTTMLNFLIPEAGIANPQIQAAWIEDITASNTGSFPADETPLYNDYDIIPPLLFQLMPNLKLMYFSGRIYGAYSNGISTLDPEPYAYEDSYGPKWAIADQLNGLASLNFDPTKGTVVSPWMAWGPYYWANGMLGRNDGLFWSCQDVIFDGVHPSDPVGRLKVADQLINFFKTDTTTTPWYLATGSK